MNEDNILKYQLITTNEQLSNMCRHIDHSMIALDTEFIRTRTFYPKLGLIQLYWGDGVVRLIDPLIITDWSPFIAILAEPTITKILHACSEDLQTLRHHLKQLPINIIDTQIAAAFAGHSVSAGFSQLTADYLHVNLTKEETRTDWLARPLTEKQYQYAAADVYYLLPLAENILQKVTPQHLVWLKQACDAERQKYLNEKEAQFAYLSISHGWKLNCQQLACLQQLATWRMEYAQQHDLALNFVVKEDTLWKIAYYQPTSVLDLSNLGINNIEIRIHGKKMLQLIKSLPPSEQWPNKITRVIEYPNYKEKYKKINSLIQMVEKETGFQKALLASRKQIDQYIKWKHHDIDEEPELISGWRKDLFYPRLEGIMQS